MPLIRMNTRRAIIPLALTLLIHLVGIGAGAVKGLGGDQLVKGGGRAIALKCPLECLCKIDFNNRLQTVCTRGGLKQIPIAEIDSRVDTLIISGPRNYLTIGPIFQSIRNLRIIKITHSNVPSLGYNSFFGLSKLRLLDLSHNNISTIDKGEFNGQGNLQELNLSHNKIRRTPSGLFYYLQNLTRLNLAHNQIDELAQRQFLMLVNLHELDLSGNPLQDLQPKVFEDVQGLRVLKLRGCRLKIVNPRLYNQLPWLTELDLGNNQFEFLDREEFGDLRRLQVLRLDGNQLTVLVDSLLAGQRNLQVLDVSRNRLVKMDQFVFERLSNLTHLDVSYNKFANLEMATMKPLVSLRVLNVSGNVNLNLNELRPVLKALPQLHSLSLADFGRMPNHILSAVPEIRGLNLSGNHLSSVDLHILSGLGHLKQLDLSRNQLNGVTERTAARLERIADVRLENNPLICDKCHMGAIINRSSELSWPEMPTCHWPERLRGVSVAELELMSLDWCINDYPLSESASASEIIRRGQPIFWSVVIGSAAMLLGLIFLIIVVVYTRHRAKYYTHEDNMNDLLHVKRKNSGESITENNNHQDQEDQCRLKFAEEGQQDYPRDYILPQRPPATQTAFGK